MQDGEDCSCRTTPNSNLNNTSSAVTHGGLTAYKPIHLALPIQTSQVYGQQFDLINGYHSLPLQPVSKLRGSNEPYSWKSYVLLLFRFVLS
jgi:hypothetical protein